MSAAAAAEVTDLTKTGKEGGAGTDDCPAAETIRSDTNDSGGNGGNKPKTVEQTRLEDSPQVAYQKATHWNTITPGQLVWHQSSPAIVIPERLLAFAPVSGPEGGVMAYGPGSKDVTPSSKREMSGERVEPLWKDCAADGRVISRLGVAR